MDIEQMRKKLKSNHAKKLKLIDQIDETLDLLDKPPSLYNIIVDTLSIMQLQAIKAELLEELKLQKETKK